MALQSLIYYFKRTCAASTMLGVGYFLSPYSLIPAEAFSLDGAILAQSTDDAPAVEPEKTEPNSGSDEKEIIEEETVVDEPSEENADDGTAKPEAQPLGQAHTDVEPAPKIQFDLEALPFPTRKMRQLIYDAAKTGDIENLRPYIGYGDNVTMLSLGGYDEDPIDFLKSISGDPLGQELLAIITEILEAGYVLIDEGTDRETYVWPYFFAHSLKDLTPEQKVQLYRIITFGDYQDMESFGSYIFYRLGISPEGRWRFFVAGD